MTSHERLVEGLASLERALAAKGPDGDVADEAVAEVLGDLPSLSASLNLLAQECAAEYERVLAERQRLGEELQALREDLAKGEGNATTGTAPGGASPESGIAREPAPEEQRSSPLTSTGQGQTIEEERVSDSLEFVPESPDSLLLEPSKPTAASLNGNGVKEVVEDQDLPGSVPKEPWEKDRESARDGQDLRVVGWAKEVETIDPSCLCDEDADWGQSEETEHTQKTPYAKFVRVSKGVMTTRAYNAAIFCVLMFALFGGGLWTIFDIPDEPGLVVLDFLMFLVMFLFLAELIMNCLVFPKEYPLSFFFWMDCLGTASMVFEISVLLGNKSEKNGNNDNDAVLLRSARAAKVGARVGRLSKIMKCFVLFHRNKPPPSDETNTEKELIEAKVLSQLLMINLSTKVSLLTFLLVLVVPLFQIGQYPEVDLSMNVWSERLELEYSRLLENLAGGKMDQAEAMSLLELTVAAMKDSYEEVNYFPYRLEGYDTTIVTNGTEAVLSGTAFLSEEDPNRAASIVRHSVEQCLYRRTGCDATTKASICWCFREPQRMEAATDILMILFIITVMVGSVGNLSYTLDGMLVRPIEKMLGHISTLAVGILNQFQKATGPDMNTSEADNTSQFDDEGNYAETELLEAVFGKLARLASLSTERNVATKEDMEQMDDEGKGVILEMMHLPVGPQLTGGNSTVDLRALGSFRSDDGDQKILKELPVEEGVLESFDCDLLSMDDCDRRKVVLYIFFDSKIGMKAVRGCHLSLDIFHAFESAVKSEYNDVPYHCYMHACDVLHFVFRLLCLTHAPRWLSQVQQYALLIAALCHDIGHEGKTNPFLIETGHELAMRYNDLSPLENMHCSKLFEISSREGCNVFRELDPAMRREARRVCVSSILHTDNAKHFEMVKEINQIYEMASEICEAQASSPSQQDVEGHLTALYEEKVLQKDALVWLQLFLHVADCSNPLKPFPASQSWADRILSEFFTQGDSEKELGLPVGMLNDRDKVNKPGSQHSFINFLVAPLVTSCVRLFPMLWPLAMQMANNLDGWRLIWEKQANPSEEDMAKREAEVMKVKETAVQLQMRATPNLSIKRSSVRLTMRV